MPTVNVTSPQNYDTLGLQFTVYGTFDPRRGDIWVRCQLQNSGGAISTQDTKCDTSFYWQVDFSLTQAYSDCTLAVAYSSDGTNYSALVPTVLHLTIQTTIPISITPPNRFGGNRGGCLWGLLSLLDFRRWFGARTHVGHSYHANGICRVPNNNTSELMSRVVHRAKTVDTKKKSSHEVAIDDGHQTWATTTDHNLGAAAGQPVIHEVRLTKNDAQHTTYYTNLKATVDP